MKTLRFFRDIFKRFTYLIIVNIILLTVVGIIEASSIFTLVPVIDLFLKSDNQSRSFVTRKIIEITASTGLDITAWKLGIIFIIFNFTGVIFRILAHYLLLYSKYVIIKDFYSKTFEELLHSKWYFFSSNKQGVLLNTFIREIYTISDGLTAMLTFFAEFLLCMVYCTLSLYISWKVVSISIASALILACPFLWLSKICYQMGKKAISSSNELSSNVDETFSLAKVILGFANQEKVMIRLNKTFDDYFLVSNKFYGIRFSIPLIYSSLGIAVFIITIFTGRKLGVPLAEITALIYILYKIVVSISRMTTGKTQLDNFFPSYEQLKEQGQIACKLKQKTGTIPFTGIREKIHIEGLSYSYPGNEPVLTDINIEIPGGKMIAIVGESGSGKSTLIDLIMGFDEPTGGQIKLNEVNLQNFDIISYRKKIGYVPQNSMLFNMTIMENLLWAKEDATEEEIKKACKEANAEEFIDELPDGYNTVVGDRGVRLSGGQVQRISLARAILKKPDILVLDEATSSLDSNSERLIQEAIERIAKDTTVVIIAHRLSSIINADYIYVIKKGQIIEKGTYGELIQSEGEFKHMVQLQTL